jgi:hypothetical protein
MAEPTRLTGYVDDAALLGEVGLETYGAMVDAILEHVPELVWPVSIRTYSRMRHEPQIAAVLKVYFLAIQRARWSVDGTGCRDEVTAQIADDLGLPVNGTDEEPTGARRRRFTWAEHLRLSLLDQVYGHMFFEQAWVQEAGRFRLAAVSERMPQTIADVHIATDGTLASIVQEAGMFARNPRPITTANGALVYYVNEREGSNYFGRSPLRPSYADWLIKGEVLRVHATAIRRFGLGIPYAEAKPGAMPAEVAELQRMVAGMKATEHMGAALPHGATLKLAGLQGSVPDAVAFLNYLDRQMTRSTLTSLLDMATAERGARSLGETVMDLMVYAQQAVADSHAGTGTSQIVVPLVDANWSEDEPAPRIVCNDVGADIELTAQDIFWLTSYAALTTEPELENWIRQRYGIPTLDAAALAELRKEAAAAVAAGAGNRPLGHLIPPTPKGGE